MRQLIQDLGCSAHIPRHRHRSGYIAVVISGAYFERGDQGRFGAAEGQIVVHDAFEAHADDVSAAGAHVLNLPLHDEVAPPFVLGSIGNIGDLIALASRRASDAARWLLETAQPCSLPIRDWPDLLASDLRRSPIGLSEWAEVHNLSGAALSRGFQKAFGVTPSAYRLEAAARRAWRASLSGEDLAQVAAKTGFSDQAHMTRSVRALTGRTPGRWRKGQHQFRYF